MIKKIIKVKKKWQQEIWCDPGLAGKVIAICDDRIVYAGDTYADTITHMKNDKGYSLFKVPKNIHNVRILSFKIKSFKKHPWIPAIPVKFYLNNSDTQTQEMLVDSGADVSLINYEFGKIIGFNKSPHEALLDAGGIGGSVQYLLRTFTIEIEGIKFENIFAWLQDDCIDEMIIGREVVFDLFDIEFKQADEKIIFKHRG